MRQASSSSSCNSTSLTNRLKTIFKKAYELSVLCGIDVCVIYYGPDGRLKTWPKEKEKVKDMAMRYKEARKRNKSLNLHEFLEKEKDKDKDLKKKKKQRNNVKYPNFDHYSPQQLSQLIRSLEQTLSKLQERLRFVEGQKKQRNTYLVNPNQQPLNPPSKFSLYMYNHEDATFSQLPLSTSQSNQLTNYQNHHLMKQEPYGYNSHNMITNTNFQHPYVSTTQDYSQLLPVQASAVRLKNNHLMQKQELYGSHQNMPMISDIINNNNVLQHPHLSNTAPHDFSADFQNIPYGENEMVGNTNFSQYTFSSYDTSTLPSLHTIPNSYCLSDIEKLS